MTNKFTRLCRENKTPTIISTDFEPTKSNLSSLSL